MACRIGGHGSECGRGPRLNDSSAALDRARLRVHPRRWTWVEQASLEPPPDPYSSPLTVALDRVTLDGETAIVASSTLLSSASHMEEGRGLAAPKVVFT